MRFLFLMPEGSERTLHMSGIGYEIHFIAFQHMIIGTRNKWRISTNYTDYGDT